MGSCEVAALESATVVNACTVESVWALRFFQLSHSGHVSSDCVQYWVSMD